MPNNCLSPSVFLLVILNLLSYWYSYHFHRFSPFMVAYTCTLSCHDPHWYTCRLQPWLFPSFYLPHICSVCLCITNCCSSLMIEICHGTSLPLVVTLTSHPTIQCLVFLAILNICNYDCCCCCCFLVLRWLSQWNVNIITHFQSHFCFIWVECCSWCPLFKWDYILLWLENVHINSILGVALMPF